MVAGTEAGVAILTAITPAECRNFFTEAGYALKNITLWYCEI
jgi:hypothetical protein